ncbi:AAA family ATPase [Pseudomonas sp. MBLB4136]|uniref:AAA family ATPase n=1 Tax=Pseudomonas sp. MBLB4136 TaxID=3451558 RepID=UPI003F756C35
MKVSMIELRGVKSFDGATSVILPSEISMCAFSGKNGAGKSTLLKAVWLVQKAYFIELLNNQEISNSFSQELRKYLSGKDSYIRVTFKTEESDLEVNLTKDPSIPKGYSITCSDDKSLKKRWNLLAPNNIVLYIDASKGFSEATLTFDGINIKGNDKGSLVLEAILNPESLFSGIYSQLVKDYVHDRLIPSKPDRLLYFHIASKLFTHLIPTVELRNFSGNHMPGEFVLLGKAGRDKARPLYDVRDFSSGEKALLSTLTFLCVSKTVSTLIIDEPENHFHESLLLEFVSVLHRLCETGGIHKWMEGTEGRGKKVKLDWVAAEYKDHNINQVLVSTHSRSLIYKFFLIGKNYIVDNGVSAISYEDAEAELRNLGLSSIYSKVLLVEGDGDHEALEHMLQDQNIQIKPLNGSSAVIDTFKRLAELKDYVQESKFVFLVDSDNKPDTFFDKVSAIDPQYYKDAFIRIDRHEFENYFLDPEIIKASMDGFLDVSGEQGKKLDVTTITSRLIEIARDSLPSVYKKELSLIFQQVIERKFSSLIWGNKDFSWVDAKEIQEQLMTSILTDPEFADLKDLLSKESKGVFEKYNKIDNANLLKRCDGKQVLSRAASYFSNQAGVTSYAFKKAVYKTAFSIEKSDASMLVGEIITKLG